MLRGSLYIFASKLLGYATRLALPILLVRILSKTDFGVYRQFFLFEAFIATLFQFGINQSLYYFIPRDRQNAGSYFLNSICLNLVIYGIVFLVLQNFRGPLADYLNLPVVERYFWPLAAFTLVMMLLAASDFFLLAQQLAKQSALFEVVGSVCVNIITIVTGLLTHSLTAIIIALILARTLRLLAYLAYIHFRLHGFAAQRYFFDIWPQIRYGMVLGLGGAAWSLMLQMHGFFVNRYYGVEQYAIYAAGCTQIPILQLYLMSIVSVSLGQFALQVKEEDWAGVQRLWRKIQASLFGLGIPVILLLLAVSEPLITLMFTESYAHPAPGEASFGAVQIFRIFVLSWLYLLFNGQLVIRALGRNDVTLYVHLTHLGLAPFVLYGLMQLLGAVGIITGHALLLISARVSALIVLNRVSGLRLPYGPTLPSVMAFYRDVFGKGRDWLLRRGARPA